MNRFREKLRSFMIGRYGMDSLGRFLLGLIMVLIIINLFVKSSILYYLEMALLALCYARMLSRDFEKRQKENNIYARLQFQAAGQWEKWKYRGEQTIHYHIYKCPSCGQKIRIPRGRGKISIHCPKCHTDFIRHS